MGECCISLSPHIVPGIKFNIQTAVTDSQLELSYYMFQTFVSLSAGMIHASGCPSVRWLGLFFSSSSPGLSLPLCQVLIHGCTHSYKLPTAISQPLKACCCKPWTRAEWIQWIKVRVHPSSLQSEFVETQCKLHVLVIDHLQETTCFSQGSKVLWDLFRFINRHFISYYLNVALQKECSFICMIRVL